MTPVRVVAVTAVSGDLNRVLVMNSVARAICSSWRIGTSTTPNCAPTAKVSGKMRITSWGVAEVATS